MHIEQVEVYKPDSQSWEYPQLSSQLDAMWCCKGRSIDILCIMTDFLKHLNALPQAQSSTSRAKTRPRKSKRVYIYQSIFRLKIAQSSDVKSEYSSGWCSRLSRRSHIHWRKVQYKYDPMSDIGTSEGREFESRSGHRLSSFLLFRTLFMVRRRC